MSDKQTRCPNCFSIYKVTVPQLTVAQGKVCCPKCNFSFNALLYLVELTKASLPNEAIDQSQQQRSFLNRTQVSADFQEPQVLDIFKRKAKHANLDLRQYLNQLKYDHQPSVCYFPALNLSKTQSLNITQKKQSKHLSYYYGWGVINFLLAVLLILQMLWFNPSLLDRSPMLTAWFQNACTVLNCETIDQRYQNILVKNLTIEPTLQNQTAFSGELISHYPKSLKMPKLKVTFQKNGQSFTHIITASEYLITSLNGISRIPAQQPYSFKFILSQAYSPSQQYQIQIIRP